MPDHALYMRKCLELAAEARGRTSPNPLVGSVVVADDGRVIASGFHQAAGQAHAEVNALDKAGDAARGQTLYVNLEPCCHQGRTGPCSQRVIESGVKRVVIGTLDPNPKVAGFGVSALQAAGIEVIQGIEADSCRHLNRAFFKWITTGLPWLCLKMATTLDGKIADRTGSSRWITAVPARHFVHELRSQHDCVLAGGATVVADDAQLLARDLSDHAELGPVKQPLRAVVASSGSALPGAQARVFQKLDGSVDKAGATLVFTDQENPQACSPACQYVRTARAGSGSGLDLAQVLAELGRRSVLSVLCEGGGRLAGALLSENHVDEVVWIVAAKLLPDGQARAVTQGTVPIALANALELIRPVYKQVGPDLVITGLLKEPA